MGNNKPEFKQKLTEEEMLDLIKEITIAAWTNKRLVVRPTNKFKYLVYKGEEVYSCGNFIDIAVKTYNEI